MTQSFNGQLLAKLRSDQRYSQRELERAAGLKSGFVAALEGGDTKEPGYLKLRRVAEVLGVDPDIFFAPDAVNVQQPNIPPDEAA